MARIRLTSTGNPIGLPAFPLTSNADPLGPELRAAVAHHQAGRRVEAERTYRRVVAAGPDGPRKAHALHLLGLLARDCGHLAPAAELLAKSAAMLPATDPAAAEFASNLGAALFDLNRRAEAADVLAAAAERFPGHAGTHHNLGVVLESLGRMDDAAAASRRAIAIRPDYAAAHNNLGAVLRHLGQIDEAEASHRRALALNPDDTIALTGLGHTHGEQGRLADCIACYGRILDIQPDAASVRSDLLYTLHYDDALAPEALFAEHLAYARRHAEPLAAEARVPHEVDRGPHRRLRVGYVSSDLRGHPVARFLEPALANGDRAAVEVYCYSDARRPDGVTARLRRLSDVWRDTSHLSDEALAAMIRADRIDVLVDLDGHASGGRRMGLFARRPAPVQAAHNGYVGTTGLATMDWRITDAVHDPPGTTERFHTERLYRLPACNWCYAPDADAPDAAAEPPCIRNGHVTFGSANKFVKASPTTLRLWAAVLAAVPGSRLRVATAGTPPTNRHPLAIMAAAGIPIGRVDLVPKTPTRGGYLRRFAAIDVCLDTFPFNGITTTCDALWMGVPTVSLAGASFVSRAGASILGTVGLGDLVAQSADVYVAIAAALAADPARLAGLRAGLRDRMADSPLCDGPGFARRLEAGYRDMWAAMLLGTAGNRSG